MLWGNSVEGSTGDTAARSTSAQWLFAEGTRKGPDYFLNYFLLFNPLPYPLTIIGEYFLDGSSAPVTRTYNVPASGRFTVDVNFTVPELAGKDFSARYRSADGSSGFVAQRAMYWGANFLGGHSANGVPADQTRWFFAEGAAAPNFDTYYTLLNPNAFDVERHGHLLHGDRIEGATRRAARRSRPIRAAPSGSTVRWATSAASPPCSTPPGRGHRRRALHLLGRVPDVGRGDQRRRCEQRGDDVVRAGGLRRRPLRHLRAASRTPTRSP